MRKKVTPRKFLARCLGVVVILLLALTLWRFSPGPEWIATRTAEKYLEQHAPEYCEIDCGKGTAERYFYPLGFRITVSWPTWLMIGEPEGGRDGKFARLELEDGIFPLKVTAACIVTYNEDGILDREVLPVPG